MEFNINCFKSIKIPHKVSTIINAFKECGFEIYLVGGCVRDSLIGRQVSDWDLCTNATPDRMLEICSKYNFKYVPTGLKHGTVKIFPDSIGYEVTTYRVEGSYSDSRHPDSVDFTNTLREDLARRDFTINALAYNEESGIVDYFEGIDDLKRGRIRCVGNPNERFNEDSLRRLRAVRFAVQLGFHIEQGTYRAVQNGNESLNKLSKERLRDEFVKILLSANAGYGLIELYRLNMLEYIVPELVHLKNSKKNYDLDYNELIEHTAKTVQSVDAKLSLRLAALLSCYYKFSLEEQSTLSDSSIDKSILSSYKGCSIQIEEILKTLRVDNKTINRVKSLLLIFNYYEMDMSSVKMKKMIGSIGKENVKDAFSLIVAYFQTNPLNYDRINNAIASRNKCLEIIDRNLPIEIGDLMINGSDLIQLGVKNGVEIGILLEKALQLVIYDPELNTREDLMAYIRKQIYV